jgi:hypothetical protein
MADTKEIKNVGSNFPRGTLEEMLRMMRERREKGNIECENILKELTGKNFKNVDYKKIKKKLFGKDSK